MSLPSRNDTDSGPNTIWPRKEMPGPCGLLPGDVKAITQLCLEVADEVVAREPTSATSQMRLASRAGR
jgi:hypothetical protein